MDHERTFNVSITGRGGANEQLPEGSVDSIWLKEYPPGIPPTIDADRYRSLIDLLQISFAQFAARPAFSNLGYTLSYAAVDRLSRAFAAYLQRQIGLAQGSRVALMLPNLLQYPVALFGILRAGLVVVNVNPLYTPRELRLQLCDSSCQAIVILENFAHTLAQVLPDCPLEHVIVTRVGDLLPAPRRHLVNLAVRHVRRLVPRWHIRGALAFNQALAAGQQLALQPVDSAPTDVAFLQYTGGTTGTAKGAMLTQRNLVANVLQVNAWLQDIVVPGREVVVAALPLYHIFALTVNCLLFTALGEHIVLITNPRDLPHFVKTLRHYPFTVITGVNTLYNALLDTPGFEQLDCSHLKAAIAGGMALQRTVAERWKQVTGRPLLEGYGLTEASPVVCVNPLTLTEYNGSIGLPLPSTEVSVRGSDGNELALGETGELCVRGPQVMAGYWGRPEATAAALDAAGWLRSGDMARIDPRGYVYIVDRKKDMILVSGFNVYPNEIEDVLTSHPGIAEAAVIGVDDERSGERVKAFVVRRDPSLQSDAIIRHCRQHLTPYKVPRQVEFRDQLPKTNVGKILRRALRNDRAERP